MQHRVTGAVGRGAGAANRLLAKIRHMATERPLVNLAGIGAIERHAVMLEFDHALVGLATHELDGILVTEPVGALDRIVHMPVPMVLLGVAEGCRDAALGRDRMRTGRKNLGQYCRLESGLRQLDGGTQPGTAGTDNHRIKSSNRVFRHYSPQRIWIVHPA